jgi:UDP-glucose 4-epimerase
VKVIVEKIAQQQMMVRYRPQRNIDMVKVVLDCTKVMIKTGWKPAVDLEQGIFNTWKWLKKQKNKTL